MPVRFLLFSLLVCALGLSACKSISLDMPENFVKQLALGKKSEVNLTEVANTLRSDIEHSRPALLSFESRLPQQTGWDVWRYQEKASSLADFTLEHLDSKKWVVDFDRNPATLSYIAIESLSIFEGLDGIIGRHPDALSEQEQLRYDSAREALEGAYQVVLSYRESRSTSDSTNTVHQALNLGHIGVELARALQIPAQVPVEPEEALSEATTPVEPENTLGEAATPVEPENALSEAAAPVEPENALSEAATPVAPEKALSEAAALEQATVEQAEADKPLPSPALPVPQESGQKES